MIINGPPLQYNEVSIVYLQGSEIFYKISNFVYFKDEAIKIKVVISRAQKATPQVKGESIFFNIDIKKYDIHMLLGRKTYMPSTFDPFLIATGVPINEINKLKVNVGITNDGIGIFYDFNAIGNIQRNYMQSYDFYIRTKIETNIIERLQL